VDGRALDAVPQLAALQSGREHSADAHFGAGLDPRLTSRRDVEPDVECVRRATGHDAARHAGVTIRSRRCPSSRHCNRAADHRLRLSI